MLNQRIGEYVAYIATMRYIQGFNLQHTLNAFICPFIAGISPCISSPAKSIPTTPSLENSLHKERISNDHSKKTILSIEN